VVMGPKPVATDQLGQKLKRRSIKHTVGTPAGSITASILMMLL
jgi:hypothetical protein